MYVGYIDTEGRRRPDGPVVTAEVLAAEIEKDPVLRQVREWAREGWPRRQPEGEAGEYWRKKDQISIVRDCVLERRGAPAGSAGGHPLHTRGRWAVAHRAPAGLATRHTPTADAARPARPARRGEEEGEEMGEATEEGVKEKPRFRVGQPVWVRQFGRKGKAKWMRALTVEELGRCIWICKLKDHTNVKRHVAQMRRRSDKKEPLWRKPLGYLSDSDEEPCVTPKPWVERPARGGCVTFPALEAAPRARTLSPHRGPTDDDAGDQLLRRL
ncbi:Adenylosuccinate synthetase, partial [Frankliniella fusca]